jgi:hypothetical protein
MSERWIKESEQLLRRMKTLSSKEQRDRLEIINSILFALTILERSLNGWKLWVRNLSLMSQFELDELMDIEKALGKQIQPFIEYDVEATKKWKSKFPQQVRRLVPRPRREAEESRGLYV